MQQLQQVRCPMCNSEDLSCHTIYTVLSGERRKLYHCNDCGDYFSETKNTPLAGLRRAMSFITMVLDALNDGMSINATCRTFHVSKNSIKRWLKRLADVKETLLLYALYATNSCNSSLKVMNCTPKCITTSPHRSAKAGQSSCWTGRRGSFGSCDVTKESVVSSRQLCKPSARSLSRRETWPYSRTANVVMETSCSRYAEKCSARVSPVVPRRHCPRVLKFGLRTKAHKRTERDANGLNTKHRGMNTLTRSRTWKTTRFMPITPKPSIVLYGGECRVIGARQTPMPKSRLPYKRGWMHIGLSTISSALISPPSRSRRWFWAF